MIPALFWIETATPGRLALALRPRGGDWLGDEVLGFGDQQIDLVVSLLTGVESAELGLVDEAAAFRSAGIDFETLPVPDRGIPPEMGLAVGTIEAIRSRLEAGRNVAVRCRQGIGRSAMLAAAVLVAGGEHPGDAWQRVRNARGAPVPDTDAQRDWVYQFAAAHRVS